MDEQKLELAIAQLIQAGGIVVPLVTFCRALTLKERQEYNDAVSQIARWSRDLNEVRNNLRGWARERGLLAGGADTG